MKPIQEFLSKLAALDVKLWVDGTSLRCNAPQGTLTPEIRTQLSDRKAEIIKFLQDSQLPLIPRSSRYDEPLPLSWAQERLWFLNQLEGSTATYNMPAAVCITGNLDVKALQQALSEIVRRHSILRTSIETVNGTPRQVIHPEAIMNINVVDLQQLLSTERQTLQKQLILEEANTPFSLEIAPLIRCSLLQLSGTEYVLLLTMHHIVSDGWSMGVFIQELSALYPAFCTGVPSPLPELPIQYADFAVWQRQWLSGDVLQNQLNYWLSQLHGAPSLLQLPTDRPRPVVQTYQGRTYSFTLNTDLTQKLQSLSGESGTTLFMTLLAAFATLLYRYSGQSDILIGSPIANRNRSEVESLIGFFVNTLVLRIRFEDDPSFESLLSQVRETTLKAYEHQDVPFEQVVEALQPQRSLAYSPLFQVWVNMLNLEDNQSALPGLFVEPIALEKAASKFDLSLYIAEKTQGIELKLVYNADLFAAERMVAMLQQFHHLLNQIVTAPNNPISVYSFVTPESLPLLPEPRAVLPQPEYKLVTTMFTSWVNSNPEHLAISQGSRSWNYGELSRIAQTLARVLLVHGVKRGDVVAVFGTRSFGLIASTLGVFLSGGVLLTIDPQLPSDRQQLMLKEAKAKCLIYINGQRPENQEIWESLTRICVDADTGKTVNYQDCDTFGTPSGDHKIHLPQIAGDDAAYIFFTSGTAGIPKGVLGSHKGMSHFLNWQRQTFGIGANDRIAQLTGLSFDVVLRDIFLPLTSGATLCLPLETDNLEPRKILGYLEREQISVLHTVPSLAESWLVNVPTEVSLRSLRWLFFAGEPLKETLVNRWRQIFPASGEIVNLYGPTETTLAKCYYQVPATPTPGVQPIGLPLPETQALVFTQNHQLCGIGEAGEIVLRTPFRSLGYTNTLQQNLRGFVKNPFRNDEQDLLYYTGDYGRYRLDGSLEILGRRDHQVKIRGIRIEPGEIEAVLNTHPQIQQAVVIATGDIPGNKRLVAYVVSSDESLTIYQIREFLKQKLPEYMIPSAFVTLDTLPLTPNGKIDKKALPKPDGEITREQEYIAPRTPNEEIIANIFTAVLGVQNVGIHDNFFSLGGHSLLATQLISRLRVAFGVEIPIRAVFESPTVTQLDQTITQLRTTDSGLTLPPIQPIEGDTEPLPLSWAQERLWFLNQLEGSSATYNIPAAVRITGALDINALQQALSEIVHRHEVLRTSFPTVNGTPRQVIHPEVTMNITFVDLQQSPTPERETVLRQQALEEAITPFDLEKAPLIRCSLVQLDATEYVLLLTMHHIVCDGWSIGVLIQELSTLYPAFCAKLPSPLPELPIQYADFAIWQRQWLSGQVLETQLNYWLTQLHGAPELLQLPTDRPRPVVQTFRGTTQSWTLNTDLTQKLQSLSRESGTTLFMTLLAGFATLVYRYSGQSDILIGSPVANRHRSEIESLIGFFVNTLVLRCRFEENPSFEQLLLQVRETTLKAYENQDVSFEQIVEALQPQRSLSHSPLFCVMFALQNAPMGELELLGVTLSEFNQQRTIAKFDLTLSVSETSQGLVGEWEYNTDLFDSATIERMATHFQNLLSAIVENPQLAVGELPLLSEAERHQLLVEWNDTESVYPTEKCIHQLFEEQVQKTPHNVAVVFENQQLTYQQLNQRANQLAHHLQSLGVGPEVLVGICVERSIEMVVGLLGILKAGGAYVPLDPTYPLERLSYMLADSGVEVLLTQQKLLESLPQNQARVVCLDTDWGAIEQHSQENFYAGVSSDNLAYVIYTSGSTGQPKGVLVTHQNLVNHSSAIASEYNLSSWDKVLQFAALSFDVAVEEIFPSWLSGAAVVLRPQEMFASFADLVEFINTERLTVLNLPAVFWHQWVLDLSQSSNALRCLRLVVVGSEQVQWSRVAIWQKYVGNYIKLYNAYGSTEATITATVYQLDLRHLEEKTGSVPIGRPIANTQIYILDQHHQPVPIGVPGELYIGGDGLARGYFNRPELTQEKFISNRFSDAKSKQLYKTGDLARYKSDGNIEFLGRIDNQVKIRGFRIELGEIEAVLNTHPHIQQAVVIATEDIIENKSLVAYVVPSGERLTTNQLREFLKQQLPEYMIPSGFVTLDILPLTPNGKIDKKALPKPDGEITRETQYVAPRTPNEEIIANIFAAVLGVQNVGIHDNFFSLGGHSLLATQLISRLRVAFTVEIPIRAVFESPTVTQLDQTITQLRTTDSGLTLPPIQPIEGDTEPLPLSWAQERLWFLNQLEGSSATYNIPAAVRITGALDINALQQALSEIVHRHEVLRTSFPTVNGTPRQVIHPEVTININVVDLQQILGTECETVQKQLVLEEAITPFDLEVAPLIRCSCVQLSATEYVLLVTMHHIVSDGWSIGVFIQELSALYPAFCTGVPSPLPELPIQYGDFAVWQRQWLSGLVLETQLNYWLSQLHGAPSLLQLPTDRPRPVVQTYQGRTYSFTLNTDLTQKLQSLSGESGTTLFMTLLAAFATLLYRYTGQSDILVGSPIANRNRTEIESLIGFFVNTLVLRTRFETNPSFESLLSQVRETTLKAYEHQDVPFEQVVEALQPQRSLSHSPLFQVMFVLQNAIIGEVELPGVTLTQLAQEGTVAKFDLTLSMSETDQGLIGSWEYNTDLFDTETIERMVGHFQNLLSAIVANPLLPVGKLPLLSETERHQLLVEWNDTECEYPSDKCIHQLFEAQVEKTPDTMAVVFEDEQLTYLELNQRANQLAHHLQSLGVKPEVLVGICVKRSIEMVVGLLAILKAGGAYVPLDPTYPQERLSYMLADSQLPILLTQQHLLKQLPVDQAQTICLDEDCQNFAEYSQDNPCQEVKADNLAYVIYTSGSSGKPKGTMILHSGIVNYLSWCTKAYNVATGVGSTVNSSIGFDATITSLFSPLLVGSKVVILPEEGEIEALKTALCSGTKFSLIKITPAHLEILSHLFASEQVNIQTQAFIIGGEALTEKVTSFWQKNAAATRLINEYGPTETVVGCCVYEIGKLCFPGSNIPIGRPIANTQIYILDQHHQPVPIGVPGELYIGGDGLARGYFNRPELTQEKFISNRFSDAKSKQLYKTGDLARYKSDGNIEFLGRIDNQVKIRGFRIEPGEIEAVLNTHPQIQQAVVIATGDIPGNKRLVAYVVSSDESLTIYQIREFLKQKLPEYMIPSAFVTLDTLPLTPNGKIDKKALPKPDGEITREQEYIAPRTPNEEIIANIFTAVLGVQNVGIHDNFFSLGGHSLLATQLISRLRVAFTVEIPIRAVFESPTVTQLDQTITQLRTTDSGLTLPPIQPIEGDTEPLPLSWAQERLWFLNQLEGSSATYNIPAAVRITGALDINALQQALSEIVHRHEVLRTSFPTVNGTPRQVIHPEVTININVVDLQQILGTECETVQKQLVLEEAITPFDLEVAPLIRCSCVQLSATEYVLLVTMHHIVSDGWSIGVFIQELSALYPAFCTGVPSPLPELPIQYADFAVWQRQWLSGDVLQNQLNYWRDQLALAPELLQLPTDRPRPSVQTYHGRTHNRTINIDLTQKLQSLSRESGTTLFMTLLAAFSTLLYRYTGQSDILVGTPIANRNRTEIESLIGFFVNTLVLRTRFEEHPSFEKLLKFVRETTLKAYEHQDVPFEQVVEALQPQRCLSHSPLFQVMFVLQNAPIGELELPGVTLSKLDQQSTIAQFDLTVSFTETSQGLVGEWEYNTDLFDSATIERMATHFQNLLSAIVENPQLAVGELPLLSEAERHQLLVEWNDTESVYPTEKCIHQLFEEQVQKTPHNVAVVFENQQLTYQQLNQRANQLAHHLQSLGVGPEVLVGICVERSIEMVVGLLGILKAGGAYVPLDPTYPLERLSYMLADSGVEVLLTQQKLLESLPQNQARVVCLDTDWGAIEQHSQENFYAGVSSDNLAYVIYTSGSTGQPKGVLVTHQNLVNHSSAIASEYNLSSWDKVLQFAALSFDVAVEEIFPSWLSGAAVVLRPQEMFASFADLVEFINTERLTVLNLPAVFWHQWVLDLSQSSNALRCLRLVVVGSEQVQWSRVAIWQKYVGNYIKLYNAYGSTEATITATVYQLDLRHLEEKTGSVPIGRPIANTQIYILDQHHQPVPIGVPGELYIGGDGLARGYFNRPELTQEKFISNRFSDAKSKQLYKTGDLARYKSDGNIEFLGRIDNQVKIRGFRIELGEIEAVLNTHPHIQQAVVIATEDIIENKSLVAYVVPSGERLTTNQLREFLKQQLPEYMIPSGFVTLDILPLTPNGKIDKKALPKPDGEITRETQYVAPRTPNEEIIANIFAAVLGVQNVGIHDNFFEIGGDSILSIQVISHAKNAGIQITPKQIFQNQTIAELAMVANTTVSAECKQGIVTGVAALTPIQHWFFAQNRQDAHHYNQSVFLHIPNNVQSEFIEIALKKLLEHHDALRLRFTSVAGEYKQINQGLEDSVPFTLVDLSSTPKQKQPQVLEKFATEYQASLNLSTGPIMQVVMFNLGSESDARLLMIIHHLAVDGVSWRILLSDLKRIYQQLITQKPIEIGAKTTAFIDWAEKLNNYAQSEMIKQELNYWLKQPWSKITSLPIDYLDGGLSREGGNLYIDNRQAPTKLREERRLPPSPDKMRDIQQENTVGSAAGVSVKLSSQETHTLLTSVNEAYNTQINDILLSALVQALAEWTGNSTVVINLEGHGREELFSDIDLSRTVGWFTTLFPVLFQIPTINQPGEIIKSIKEQLRAIPNRGIGYGILRYLCKDTTVNEQLQTIQASEISFNYLGQFDQVQSETGWKFASESTGYNENLKQTRDHLLDINALVVEGELQIDWTYSSHIHTHATVEKLAHRYIQAIRSIIEHCQSEDICGYTPSDFPDVQLNQIELDKLLTQFKTKKIESIYSLSPSQQGMLFETLSASESGIHIEQCILNVQEELDLFAFERAWQRIVERHSILRTAFIWEAQNEPLQVVLKEVEISLELQDWRGLSLSQQQEKLETYLSADRLRGFNMTEPPLMRFALFQVDSNAYQFIWTSHHILTDGWCVPLIFKEVFAFYEAFSKGQDLLLEPSHPYRNYIAWLKQQDLSQAEVFWRNKLQGFKSPTPLGIEAEPVNFSADEERYGEQKARLTASATTALQSLVRQHHLSLGILVQGVWGLLLSRYSGLEDVVFGATFSGRPPELVGSESMLGLFINTLPMRLQVSPQASLWSWLKDIQDQNFTQRDYEYCSQGQIHEWSEVPGSLPLYESLLVFQNYPVDLSAKQSTNHDKNQSQDRAIGAQTKYAITILVSPTSQLEFRIIYQRSRYENPAITFILEHFQALLNSIVDLQKQSLETLIERISPEQIPQVRQLSKLVKKEPQRGFNAPRNLCEFKLVQIWEDILDIHPVSIQDNFFELGGHSLIAVRLMSQIQQHFQINLPLATLFQNPTIEQLANFLGSSTDSLPWSTLVPIKSNGNQPPLFCIHPAGGNVLCYQHFTYYLSSEQPLYGLQSVGLNPQNQPHTSIEQMATYYIQELQTLQPHGPYFLSGWSLGGLVAFEMAQQLSHQGEQVALLSLLDSYPVSITSKEPEDDAALLVDLLREDLDLCLEEMRQFEPEEQLIYIVEQAKQKNLVPEGFDLAQAHHLLRIYKLNAQAAQNYKPQYYSGSIVLFRASETDADLESAWNELVEHTETHVVPGNHQNMVSPPHVQTLAQHLQKSLEQAQSNQLASNAQTTQN